MRAEYDSDMLPRHGFGRRVAPGLIFCSTTFRSPSVSCRISVYSSEMAYALTPFRRPPQGMIASTFGLFRHRAWVVRQTHLESSLGSRGTPLAGLWAVFLRPLEGRFGALGVFLGPLGASLEPLGGFLGRLGALLGPPGAPSGGEARF